MVRSGQQPGVVCVLPDKMGGVASNVADLLTHGERGALAQYAVLTYNHLSTDIRCNEQLAVDRQITVAYSLPVENLHAVLRRLAGADAVRRGIRGARSASAGARVRYAAPVARRLAAVEPGSVRRGLVCRRADWQRVDLVPEATATAPREL